MLNKEAKIKETVNKLNMWLYEYFEITFKTVGMQDEFNQLGEEKARQEVSQ